jgi:hypothetical protein
MLETDCRDADEAVPGVDGIVFGAFFPTTGSSTTCKVQRAARFAVQAFDFRYLAIVGSDSFFRWPYFLEHWAPQLPTEGLVFGRFHTQAVFPHLYGVFGHGDYLRYPTGMGYVLSRDVAAYLGASFPAGPRLVTAGPEDAAVGLALSPLELNRVHSDFFDNAQNGCHEGSVLVHYVTDELVDKIDATGLMHCR